MVYKEEMTFEEFRKWYFRRTNDDFEYWFERVLCENIIHSIKTKTKKSWLRELMWKLHKDREKAIYVVMKTNCEMAIKHKKEHPELWTVVGQDTTLN